ncbi:MAG: hypothetical protein HQL34_05510 [Alphaproteobacteria bacterium]|nr:hypothetical protein [Alphaproteobacteria bacterium]
MSEPTALIEAVVESEPGRAFRIRVIRSGLSGNGTYYSDAVLREAVPLFDGARVFVKSDAEHLRGQGKDVRNVIGKITDARFVEGAAAAMPPSFMKAASGAAADTGEIQATLHVLQSAGDVSARLTEAVARNMTDLFGFSIDADGHARRGAIDGRRAAVTTKITRIRSVDLIVEPGAGGRLIHLVEAQEDNAMLRDEVISMIRGRRPELLNAVDVGALADDDLVVKFREAFPEETPPARVPVPVASPPIPLMARDAPTAPTLDPAEIARQVDAEVGERIAMREAVAASGLPKPAQERLLGDLGGRANITRADVAAAISQERDYISRFVESGRVSDLGGESRVEIGESRGDKIAAMFDAFFDPAHKDHNHARSFRECYREATGDGRVTGRMSDCDPVRLREAMNAASFSEVLGNSITRRMIADYRTQSIYDVWRMLGQVVPIGDFRTQERTRFGGYGDLPAVGQGDAYMPMTSPGDEKATYAVAKKGGTEELTMEMIANDDVGAIQRIPTNLSRAAKRTLGKFVLDFLRTNPAIFDGKALFHVDHGNLGSAALAAASLAAGRLAMLSQGEKDSNDPLGIGPKFLWVSPNNEETAVDLFRRNTQQDKNFIQSLSLSVVPVWYWTDSNDWCLSADPLDTPVLEIGFWNGDEEPQLYVQDNPSVGSMFTHDKVTYKIRHVYGATALDYRGVYKAVVA